MGLDLYNHSPAAKAVFDAAAAVWPDVTRLCFEGPAEDLNITINTQPCLLVVDLACAAAAQEAGITPDGTAGFSLGEIAAVSLAGLMDFEQAFSFVRVRASAMHECGQTRPGTMLAVMGLEPGQVEAVAAGLGGVYPVNYNCPGQIVVACAPDRAPAVREAVVAAGGKALPLAVSGAFHSPLMDPAAAQLTTYLASQTLGEMNLPVYANATGNVYDDPRSLLSRQVNHPVLWQRTIERMIADGFDTFVELGPGKTLAGFITRTDSSVTVANLRDTESLAKTRKLFHDD